MADKPRILVIEDDPEIRSLVRDYLIRSLFRVETGDGGTALDRSRQTFGDPDLIVLDVMLPGEDGLSICRRVRAVSRVPILMLTARGEDIDRIIGLEIGADDYMAKPFNPRELVARIRAILRRNEPAPTGVKKLKLAGLTIDLEGRSVCGEKSEIELTSAEFSLLECFVTRPGRVLSRDQLMEWTRGRRAEAFDRTIDVQLSRLRKKIEIRGEPVIKTVRNQGYILCQPVEEV